MSLEQQAQLAGYLVWVPGLIMGAAALWAAVALSRPPRRDRADRRAAIKLGAALGAMVALGFATFVGMFASGFGGSFFAGFVPGLLIGLGIGLAILASGLVGYAVLARSGVGSIALAGVIAGPLLLAGTTVALNSVKQTAEARWNWEEAAPGRAAAEAENARAEAAARERASHLTVTIMESSTTTSPFDLASAGRGTITVISTIRLVVAVHTDVQIRLTEPKTLGGPSFSIRPALDPNDSRLFQDLFELDLSRWPSVLEAGSTTTYEVDFAYDAETLSIGTERGSKGERVPPGEPGAWVLTTVVVDERQDYWSKEIQLTLAP